MNYSNNYGLALPEEDDFYDINPISENFAALDEALAETAAETETISDRIGTPPEGQTLVSLLTQNTGGSMIKSIQRIVTPMTASSATTVCSLTSVNPAKTFVIMERLINTFDLAITYTLDSTTLVLNHESYSNGNNRIFGFWIVEFA